MTPILIAGCILAVATILARMIWTAPVGHEDDTGFHLGDDPRLAEVLREMVEGGLHGERS